MFYEGLNRRLQSSDYKKKVIIWTFEQPLFFVSTLMFKFKANEDKPAFKFGTDRSV
jgi:hypothetical protein